MSHTTNRGARALSASLACAGGLLATGCGGDSGAAPLSGDGSAPAAWDSGADSGITQGDSGRSSKADAGASDAGSSNDGGVNATPADSGRSPDGNSEAGATDATATDATATDATATDATARDATATDGGPTSDSGPDAANAPGVACGGAVHSTNAPQTSLPSTPALAVPAGFRIEAIAAVPSARQLAALPNGDLLVGTQGTAVYLVPNAEASGAPGAPVSFATMPESHAQGVTFAPASCTIYVATETAIYKIPYADAQQSAMPGQAIAHVRTGGVSGHSTTSITFAGGMLYASVGSSCDACVETDPTRATVQVMDSSGAHMTTRATRVRNAIALTTNPDTGTVWAGVAGQDSLPAGHPYEFFDGVTLHPAVADYGWPDCEENNHAYTAGANCATTVAPAVELPAYSTLIGAAFYPLSPSGTHAFSTAYRGGAFIAAHGSWHQTNGKYVSPPRVVFVPMNGDAPTTSVNWTDPTRQWTDFVSGFQLADGTTRIARPTGMAVGSEGSLFVADDQNGYVYRIRPM